MGYFKKFNTLARLVAVVSFAIGLFFMQIAYAEKYAAISYNHTTGELVHERYADAKRHPASLTKVMTLYLLFDKIHDEDLSIYTKMPVSKAAAKQPPSKLGLKAGKTISINAAISALTNKSANDVAVVIAEFVAGSEKDFAKLMNDKARALGMQNTVFRNASGLPNSSQITTARDMLVLAAALIENHPGHYDRFSESSFKWGKRLYENTNKLLKINSLGVDGIKTGYINASGFNLMASAVRNNERVITILLGGKNASTRNANVEALINASFTQSNLHTSKKRTLTLHGNSLVTKTAAVPLVNGKPFKLANESLQLLAEINPQVSTDTTQTPIALASAIVLKRTEN